MEPQNIWRNCVICQ